jgi:hypothetical protein
MLSVAALAACSSTGEPAQSRITQENSTTEPKEPGDPSEPGEPTDPTNPDEPGQPKPNAKDAGGDAKPAADAGPTGPTAFTKAELQALVDDRCSPCHIDFESGGMSLANDFTTNTVGVASTELPSMKRIAKGDHDQSYLWHKVNGSHLGVGGSGARMPKGGAALTATEIDRLAKFIDGL